MEKSVLISLLKTLSKKEGRELRKFLESPFFNKRPEIIRLFDFLWQKLVKGKPIPTKEMAFQQIVGIKANYDDQQMRLWMSFLLKSVEKYLVHASFFADEVLAKSRLAAVYRQRNQSKSLDRLLKELNQVQEKRPFRNAAFYQDQFQIQLEQYRVSSVSRRMSELNLQNMSDSLDIAYLSQKLRQSCLALSHQTVYNTEYEFGLLDEILIYLKGNDLLEIPAIAVYYYAFKTLFEPDTPSDFNNFKRLLDNHSSKFPTDELGDLYLLAINFCIKRYNAGDPQFLKDEFELYKNGLERGLFLVNDSLSRYTYRNIVTVGLIQKSYDWVEQFIHENKHLLLKTHRVGTYSYSLALLEYSRKNYKAALQLLQTSDYKDILLNLAAKTVMLKIFYELEEFDLLDAHLGAMRTFIRRKKIIAYHQENYINLIRFTRKLIERNPYDREEQKALAMEMEGTKVVAEKGWLLEQL